MPATGSAGSATDIRLNIEVFDLECARRGATDDAARGKLLDTDRTTVWRWRHGKQQPNLAALTRMAQTFGIPLDQLIKQGDA